MMKFIVEAIDNMNDFSMGPCWEARIEHIVEEVEITEEERRFRAPDWSETGCNHKRLPNGNFYKEYRQPIWVVEFSSMEKFYDFLRRYGDVEITDHDDSPLKVIRMNQAYYE